MNDCSAFAAQIDDVALGDAPGSALAAHLVTCADCATELERKRALAQRIDRAVGAYVRAEPPPDLAERIASGRSGPPPARAWRARWIGIPAGIALAAALLLLFLSQAGLRSPQRGADIAAIAAWRSPTVSLLVSRGNVLGTPFTLRGVRSI
jgi:anti-sigma factor RsiW